MLLQQVRATKIDQVRDLFSCYNASAGTILLQSPVESTILLVERYFRNSTKGGKSRFPPRSD
jgi:hypothetical protein